jgi:hypothetical protein
MTARAEWCGFGVRTGRLRLLDYHEFDQYRRAASYVETPRTSGREACRRPSAGTDTIRAGDQSEDRKLRRA